NMEGHAPFVLSRLGDGSGGSGGSGGMGGSGGTGGTSSACTPSGTCADGDGMDCDGDEPVERDCSGCSILECGEGCCGWIGALGATTYPVFTLEPGLITSFSHTEEAATLELSFTGAYQMGAITFALDEPTSISPLDLRLDLDAVGTLSGYVSVSLESDNGEAGCQYPAYLDDDGLAVLDYFYANCWEDFTLTSPVKQINVRIDSQSSGDAELVVRSIFW